ncbi:CopL family metal-binding regulatory protein [Lysobacter sp. A286]
MSLQHLLLRVLLCIALILNGSGLAVAATQMQVQHATTVASTTPDSASTPDEHTTCAEHSAPATAATEAPLGDHSAAADCCEGTACDVACPAGLLATLTVPVQEWRMAPHVLAARPALADHPAPALHDRYRPPIR